MVAVRQEGAKKEQTNGIRRRIARRIAVGGCTNTPKSACAGDGKGVNKYIEKKYMKGVCHVGRSGNEGCLEMILLRIRCPKSISCGLEFSFSSQKSTGLHSNYNLYPAAYSIFAVGFSALSVTAIVDERS